MLISQLRSELDKLQAEHGDLPVYCDATFPKMPQYAYGCQCVSVKDSFVILSRDPMPFATSLSSAEVNHRPSDDPSQ